MGTAQRVAHPPNGLFLYAGWRISLLSSPGPSVCPALALPATRTNQPLYRLRRLPHRDHLGEHPSRTSFYRLGGDRIGQVRRYHDRGERRDAAAVPLELAHEIQPVSIG